MKKEKKNCVIKGHKFLGHEFVTRLNLNVNKADSMVLEKKGEKRMMISYRGGLS